jgi:formate hydrogenlyase subunit 3/multisubunit Na+/H+ antiporter MnhD subunit
MLLLIPLLPLVGFLLNASFGRRLSKSVSGGVACMAMVASFVVSVIAAMDLQAMHLEQPALVQVVFMWLPSGDLQVPFALRLDPLSTLMILVVTGIGSLIHIYSVGYMHEETDAEYARYFSYLNLFASFMLVLVLGSSFPVMFVGWEGVGLCSYLLIGFYYRKRSASDAGKKAFIVNRIGDFGFILGMLVIFASFGTLDFQAVAAGAAARAPETAGLGVMTLATLLLFVGATGKSAQLPLHVWLPDAMEGPTPVSALIHAATMVTAGVYMIGRNAVLFSHAPMTLEVVAVVGVATALMAGTIGLVQTDIKRVLAYSTVSQLGYMFLAMGMGAYAAGVFHLYTHAFFKALLFLGSGAVIHAMAGEQDIRRMGGLKKYLPVTYWTFLIGAIAIAGVPLFSGFFSKDDYLAAHGDLHVPARVPDVPRRAPLRHRRRPRFARRRTQRARARRAWWPRSPRDAARRPPVDGHSAHRAGDRVGDRGLRRRAARARRSQPDRGVPPPELRGSCLGRGGGGARAGGGRGGPCARAGGRWPRIRRRTHRADPDGRLHADRGRRHRLRVRQVGTPSDPGRGAEPAAGRRREGPVQQVLRRRDLRRGDRAADQAGVDGRVVEERGRGVDRRRRQRRGRRGAGLERRAAPAADRIGPHLRGVTVRRRGRDPWMVLVGVRRQAGRRY